MRVDDVDAALKGTGLISRGGFCPAFDDGLPDWANGANAVIVIVGNAGAAMWRRFSAAWPRSRRAGAADPLDQWTREVMTPVAKRLGAGVLFPFDGPPYFPFQRWAMKADCVWPSPLGPLIHPRYGLWHAYRAALVFARGMRVPERRRAKNPCESCAGRPCLSACPVGAFSEHGYDAPACVRRIGEQAGLDCLRLACGARRACPIGRGHQYEPAHARFHMSRFLAKHRLR